MNDTAMLVRSARDGDASAFTALVRRYQNLAQGYAYLLLGDFQRAQDVAQESFLVVFQRLDSLRDDALFVPWLKGIIFRCAGRVRRSERPWAEWDETADTIGLPPTGQQRVDTNDVTEKIILELPADLQAVVILFYLQDQSQREVAEFLEIPESTVVNRLHKARKLLHKEYLLMVNVSIENHKVGVEFTERVAEVVKASQWLVEAHTASKDKPQIFDVFRGSGKQPPRHVVIQRLPDGKFVCIANAVDAPKNAKLIWDGTESIDSSGFADDAIKAAILTIRGERRGAPRLCETGIKVIDLFCPLRTAGTVGFFGTHGVGRMVVAQEMADNLKRTDSAQAFFFFVTNWDVPGTQDILAKDKGLSHDVNGRTKTAWIISRNATNPAFGLGLLDLDVRLFCSPLKAALGLFPAIDPLYSQSSTLDATIVGEEHAALAAEALDYLRKSQALLNDVSVFELLAYGAFSEAKRRHDEVFQERLAQATAVERLTLIRAQRLEWFLSQPFHIAESHTGRKGVFVPLEKTLDGCRRILNGEFDAALERDVAYQGELS